MITHGILPEEVQDAEQDINREKDQRRQLSKEFLALSTYCSKICKGQAGHLCYAPEYCNSGEPYMALAQQSAEMFNQAIFVFFNHFLQTIF